MKKIATILIAMLGLVLAAGSAMAAGQALRVSQVYGGGGGSFNQDYIEIFNASGIPQDISGWVVEYASAAGRWAQIGTRLQFPPGTIIEPCGYILIGGATAASGASLPTPDFSFNEDLNQTNGNVGIFTGVQISVACGAEVGLVDKVGYGLGLCHEGAAGAGGPSIGSAATRKNCGLQDTDQNGADFEILAPNPHNKASGQATCCTVTPTSSTTWGRIKTIYR